MKKSDINKIIKYMAETERDERIKITGTDITCDMNYDIPESCGEGVFIVYFKYESKTASTLNDKKEAK